MITFANTHMWLALAGDSVQIWHVNAANDPSSGLPSLPTALAQQMQARGVADVAYHTMYNPSGDPADVAKEVRGSESWA